MTTTAKPSSVIGLGADCELDQESSSQLTFRIGEFAVLANGSEVTIHQERGLSCFGDRPGRWSEQTYREILERDVLTCVLPDEDDGEAHPWEWLQGKLAEQAVDVSVDDLKAVPYVVRFGPRIRRRLALGR
jgi:hypothetical protein